MNQVGAEEEATATLESSPLRNNNNGGDNDDGLPTYNQLFMPPSTLHQPKTTTPPPPLSSQQTAVRQTHESDIRVHPRHQRNHRAQRNAGLKNNKKRRRCFLIGCLFILLCLFVIIPFTLWLTRQSTTPRAPQFRAITAHNDTYYDLFKSVDVLAIPYKYMLFNSSSGECVADSGEDSECAILKLLYLTETCEYYSASSFSFLMPVVASLSASSGDSSARKGVMLWQKETTTEEGFI
jgi:hypothetical protein